MPLQRSWATLNRKVSSLPIYVREVLEFLTLIAIGVGTTYSVDLYTPLSGVSKFAKKYGCDPSTLECQTRYVINEDVFQRVLPDFEGTGQTVAQYMIPAILGWVGVSVDRVILTRNLY